MSPAARGAVFGLLAAALFGVSAPLAKRLLAEVSPAMLAGLLYLGAGTALSIVRVARKPSAEARVRAADAPALAGVVLLGGVAGPVLLLFGLARTSAVGGSLLLNLEGPLTVAVAWLLFHEHVGRHAALAMACVAGGAAVLGLEPGRVQASAAGVLCIAGACLAWALDNNLTQRLSVRDPIAVVHIKTLGAGAGNIALAAALGAPVPASEVIVASLALGSVSYGLSIVLDAYALRLVGAAREAAYFATAPFLGALVAAAMGEAFGVRELAAGAVMMAGVVFLLRERHGHEHAHEALEHEHVHAHDEHHQHAHGAEDPLGEPHAHLHRHAPLVHDHPHVPDVHHRHRH
jgi:drug/metabolite transporter (DMT)-like permease